jgi:hypothetical protein
MRVEKTIYFICSGTSSYDIINSLNDINKKEGGGFFNIFKKNLIQIDKKIEKDDFSQLENIGIQEMYMCQENKNNMSLLNYSKIYTSMDYSAIESSVIFSTSITDNVTIYPLPYISKDNNIKNAKIYDTFKKKLGYTVNNTLKKNYWYEKLPLNKFIDIKGKFPKIDWKYSNDASIPSLNMYDFYKFKKFLNSLFLINGNKNTNNLIFICNARLILDILKSFKKIKYNKNIDIIEKSSIWEVTIDIDYIEKSIDFSNYNKKYPTDFNHENLTYINNKYGYTYNKNKYILFDALEPIPIKYIKKMEFYRINNETKDLIKKRLKDIRNNENEDKNNTNNKKNTKNLLKFNF